MKDISVFVPVYNEEKIVNDHILRVLRYFKRLGKSFEIIIVDDNSSDKTSLIGRKLEKNHSEIRYEHFTVGPSRRENLARSFKDAKGKIIVYMDLDLAADLNHIRELIRRIERGADIVIGSRYKGIRARRSFKREAISRIYNLGISLFFGSKIKDHQCGFKAFKRVVILVLNRELGYDKKFIRGWFWDAEMLIRAQKKKYRIEEIPVRWRSGKKTSFDVLRELRMIPYLIKLKLRLR